MSKFIGYRVAGNSDQPNIHYNRDQFVGSEVMTEKEKQHRLGDYMPEWLTKVSLSRKDVGYVFGCRFDLRP